MAEIGVKELPGGQSNRAVEVPVKAPVRVRSVPEPTTENRGVVDALTQSIQSIVRTGLDTFRDVAVEAAPAYFAFQTARLQQGTPLNSSPGIQREGRTSEEIVDSAKKGGSTQAIAGSVMRADNTITMALIIGGVVLALVSLGRE